MQTVNIKSADSTSEAEISIDRGFNCYRFTAAVDGETVDVIDSADDFAAGGGNASGHGIPLLFPFPNRIRGGKFRWDGVDYELPESLVGYNKDNAIHGFCLDRPWRINDQGADYVEGVFQLSVDAPDRLELWPADFVIKVRYRLHESTLWSEIRIKNPDDRVLPWGFGTHPYFRLPLGKSSMASACLIEADARQEWELIDCLPTGKCRPVRDAANLTDGARFSELALDDVLTDWHPVGRNLQSLIMDEMAGLQVVQRCDAVFRELVVYTPPGRDAVCLEPYTCVTDAINLAEQGMETGWQTLEPGAEIGTWIAIGVEKIVV